MATASGTPAATWGIAPPVRRALASQILELRASLEDDFRYATPTS